ncbi:MAG: hypothetical protein IIT47_00555 [Oscillospiraceae bacterium]|nr:hypothetical protein [Oscillospiraceae bacterium]
MRGLVEQTFARYAMEVTVEHRGEKKRAKAFVQSVRRENGSEPFTVTPMGAVEQRVWRYLGAAGVPVEMGDRVCCDGMRYIVRNAMPVYAGSEIVYYWAMLHPEEEMCTRHKGENGDDDDGNGTGEIGGG